MTDLTAQPCARDVRRASEALARCTEALVRCTRATLAFDLARVDSNMARIADAAHAHGIRVLFAAKSFPHARALELAARRLDGFDVASLGELASVPRGAIISIADPAGAAISHASASAALAPASGARVIAVCETVDQVRAVPPGAEIAIRISSSLTGLDPAIGAVLEGTGHRRSRFGLDDRTHVAALAAVEHAIEDGGGDHLVAEDVAPLRDGLVGGHSRRSRVAVKIDATRFGRQRPDGYV